MRGRPGSAAGGASSGGEQRSLDEVEKGMGGREGSGAGGGKATAMTAEEVETKTMLDELRAPSARPSPRPPRPPHAPAMGSGDEVTEKLRPGAMYDQMSLHSNDIPPQPY